MHAAEAAGGGSTAVVLFQYGMCTTGSPSAHALANVASSSAAKITYPPTLPLSQEASPRTSAAGGRSPQRQAPSPRNDIGSLRNVLGSGANTAGCVACDGCSPCVVANMAENSSSMLPYETSTTVYLSPVANGVQSGRPPALPHS